MKVKEVKEIIQKAYQKLDEIGQSEIISLRLKYVELRILRNLCENLDITLTTFLRISIDHFESYLSQLTEKQLEEELIKIWKFGYRRRRKKNE